MNKKQVENFEQGGARNGAQGRGGETSGASAQHRSDVPPFRQAYRARLTEGPVTPDQRRKLRGTNKS